MPQGKNQDMIEAANESRVVFKVLQEERDEKMLWDEQFERAREMAGEWNNDPRITRLTENQHTQTVLAKSTLLISSRSLDTRAQWRVLKQHDRFLGQHLIPTKFFLLNVDTTDRIYCTYANDLTERVIFDGEIVRRKSKWRQLASKKPSTL